MKTILMKDGRLLKHASDSLKNDYDIVKIATDE